MAGSGPGSKCGASLVASGMWRNPWLYDLLSGLWLRQYFLPLPPHWSLAVTARPPCQP